MSLLGRCVAAIDCCTEIAGRALAWLVPVMVIVTCVVVVARYGFDAGSIALQEAITYLHGAVFMLGAGYALKHGAHVRVDIFYRRFTPRTRAWVDSLGTLVFLLPLCALILTTSWQFTNAAWAIGERSAEPGGLALVYLLKTLIPLLAANLALQGIAELGRNLLILLQPHPESHLHAD